MRQRALFAYALLVTIMLTRRAVMARGPAYDREENDIIFFHRSTEEGIAALLKAGKAKRTTSAYRKQRAELLKRGYVPLDGQGTEHDPLVLVARQRAQKEAKVAVLKRELDLAYEELAEAEAALDRAYQESRKED